MTKSDARLFQAAKTLAVVTVIFAAVGFVLNLMLLALHLAGF